MSSRYPEFAPWRPPSRIPRPLSTEKGINNLNEIHRAIDELSGMGYLQLPSASS
jgi:hypothetical protein